MISSCISCHLIFCNLMQSTSYETLGKENKKTRKLIYTNILIKEKQRNIVFFLFLLFFFLFVPVRYALCPQPVPVSHLVSYMVKRPKPSFLKSMHH